MHLESSIAKVYSNISCLGSCYYKTQADELILAISSLFHGSLMPAQVVLVIDGPIFADLESTIINLAIFYQEINIVKLPTRNGLPIALNKGLEHCKYDLVARYDTDDINLSDRLERQFLFMNNNQSIACIGGDVLEFSAQGSKVKSRTKSCPISPLGITISFLFRNPLNHPTVMYRKSIIKSCGGYKDFLFFEDYYLWFTLIASGFRIANLPSPPLVAMKRESQSLRRTGLIYLGAEVRFAIGLVKINPLLSFASVFLLIRAILRLFYPSELIRLPWRERWSTDILLRSFMDQIEDLWLKKLN